jgi:Transglutaminase-like superfamily
LEAAWIVAVTRVTTKIVPFRWVARRLVGSLPASEPTLDDLRIARAIGWAVSRVSRTRPLKTVCLGQAISAHLMLKKRRIPSTVYLGVAYEDSKMIAHAWVVTGDFIVTGEAGHERFTVVSRISSLRK